VKKRNIFLSQEDKKPKLIHIEIVRTKLFLDNSLLQKSLQIITRKGQIHFPNESYTLFDKSKA